MTVPQRTRRRVLADSEMEVVFAMYCDTRNWSVERRVPRDISAAIDHEVVWRASDKVLIDYVSAYLTNDSCICGLSSDLEAAEELMKSVESDLGEMILDDDELLSGPELAETPQEVMHALVRLGLGAPLSYDRDFFDVIVNHAASHANRFLRETAIYATVYMAWPEFVPILREIKASDPEEKVRTRAEVVLHAYLASGLGGEQ